MDDSPSPLKTRAAPPELTALLQAGDVDSRQSAWATFLNAYSRLILHTAKSSGSDYDQVMDLYACVVEQLREGDFRRLRTFVADGRGKFTTWLTVVVRRICLDHHRQRYGRVRQRDRPEAEGADARAARRRLVDLMADELDVTRLAAAGRDPEAQLRAGELNAALAAALGRLPSRDRLVLALRFEDDLSAREIAEVMGFPTPFHVYRRINRLLAALRQVLEAKGIDDSMP